MGKNFLNISGGVNVGSLSADPSNPVNGDIYCNSTSSTIKVYENGKWVTLDRTGFGAQQTFNGIEDSSKFTVTYTAATRTVSITYASGAAAWVSGNQFIKSGKISFPSEI